jgi:hypothetical protein
MQVQQIHAALLSKLAAARRAAVRRHLLLLLMVAVLLLWRLGPILLLLLLLVFRFRLDLASSLWMSSRQTQANIQVCVVSACT